MIILIHIYTSIIPPPPMVRKNGCPIVSIVTHELRRQICGLYFWKYIS